MSNAPKRPHEEVGHSIPSKRMLEGNGLLPNLSGNMIHPIANEYHFPVELNPEVHLCKHQRIEPRDRDKQITLPLISRAPSPSNASRLDNPDILGNIAEARDLKDGRNVKVDTSLAKTDNRELNTQMRVNPQRSIRENAATNRTKVDEREPRTGKESPEDNESQKDAASGTKPHSNGKVIKEPQRSVRYSERSGDGSEPCVAARNSTSLNAEVGNGTSAVHGEESLDNEAVEDDKLELKGEEKDREKDRRRKSGKFKDRGQRDRYDIHDNLHVGSSMKELSRQDRDSEIWDTGKKDAHKEKELEDGGKDTSNVISSNSNERGSLGKERFPLGASLAMIDREKFKSTRNEKKHRKLDSCMPKDKKRNRDHITYTDRLAKGNKGTSDKELDCGQVEGNESTERDRESFVHGIHQGRMMSRTKGSSQSSNQESCSQSQIMENGSQDALGMSFLVYKVDQCMQEIKKSWEEYEASQDCKKDADLQRGPVLEIRIPAVHITASNRQVREALLWGTDTYTYDSDLVAVLMHTGHCRPVASLPPAAIQELRAAIRVLPSQECYVSSLRNNVRSRAWGAGISCSFRVERCCIVKKGGGTIELKPHLTHVEPTLAVVSIDRLMITRSAASNTSRQQKYIREVTIQFNLCNEPWLKYNMNVVADKGLKKPQYTSARLRKGEVLYLETHFDRYELCSSGQKALPNGMVASPVSVSGQEKCQQPRSHLHSDDQNYGHDNVFRWSRCKRPLPQTVMKSIGIPLPIEHLEVLEEKLEWEDVQWSETGVWIAGKEYKLARAHFLSSS